MPIANIHHMLMPTGQVLVESRQAFCALMRYAREWLSLALRLPVHVFVYVAVKTAIDPVRGVPQCDAAMLALLDELPSNSRVVLVLNVESAVWPQTEERFRASEGCGFLVRQPTGVPTEWFSSQLQGALRAGAHHTLGYLASYWRYVLMPRGGVSAAESAQSWVACARNYRTPLNDFL